MAYKTLFIFGFEMNIKKFAFLFAQKLYKEKLSLVILVRRQKKKKGKETDLENAILNRLPGTAKFDANG